jgi:hypothetical protein
MRMMMRVTMDVEAGNAMIKSGRMEQGLGELQARLKPEAIYFTADKGKRTVYCFLDMKDPSEMPIIAEPFFMDLNADVEFQPVMNAEDLKKGLSQLKR